MRKHVNRYETEIRLGLVAIVVLLLVLNLSTTYVLYRVNRQLTGSVDRRLAAGLHEVSLRLSKNRSDDIAEDQIRLIEQRFGLKGISVLLLPEVKSQSSSEPVLSSGIPRLDEKAVGHLAAGEKLFRRGRPTGIRVGLSLYTSSAGKKLVLVTRTDSQVLEAIAAASQKTLYLAISVILLIIPMTILLPRFILEPFKKMREAARSAGRLAEGGENDEVSGVIESYRQIIEELKRNEFELKRLYRESSSKADRLEKFNRYILQSVSSGVITVDLGGKVIGYNRAAEEILGYAPDTVIDCHHLAALPGEMALNLLIEAGLERGETTSHRDIELVRESQPTIWLGVVSSLIHDDNDRTVGMVLLFTDLTELKKLHEELELNRRMAALGEMTGGLAHQLRNSLAAVSGFCQLLQKKAGQSSELGEIADSIRTEAAASEAMLNRFLNFARPLHLSHETFDLTDLIRQCSDRFVREAENRAIALNIVGGDKNCLYYGDPLLLKEALGNLIDNAIQAIDHNGRVDVSIEIGGEEISISVTDNGPGIPPSLRERIFTPFYSSKPSGTGLGLALAQKIVHLHHGRISVESGISGGAICRVVLPAMYRDEQQPEISFPVDVKKM